MEPIKTAENKDYAVMCYVLAGVELTIVVLIAYKVFQYFQYVA